MKEWLQENSGFANDDEGIPLISRRDLVIIIVVGIISASLGLFLANPMSLSLEFAPLLNSINIVSMTFATGLFSFVTAGLLFTSQASRLYLLRRINQVEVKRAYLIRTLHTFIITSVFTLIITIITFLNPNYPSIAFLPSVLGASLIVSICLASIAIALASITDDSRICVVLGCVSTIVIASNAGWNSGPNLFLYSVTRNLALLSPHNIARALAVQLSGYQFESANEMVSYVGFVVSVEGLAVALLILSSISIVLLLTGQRALSKNSTRWPVLKGMIPIDEKWDASVSAEKLQEINRIRRSLRLQRVLTTILVGVLLISMVGGVLMHSTYISSSTIFFHHINPEEGERVLVGYWNIFEVDVRPPYPGLFNKLSFFCGVENWGNASDSLSFYYGILEMNSTEFDSLNETNRLELVYSRLNRTSDSYVGFGVGKNLEESYGSFICVLRVISDADPSENSYIEARIQIIQEGH